MYECVNNDHNKERAANGEKPVTINFFQTAEVRDFFVCYIVVGLLLLVKSTSFLI
jgi:hypothetical protein